MTGRSFFPPEEHQGRLARAVEAFGASGLSHAIVYGTRNWFADHSLRYLTGYDIPARPAVLVLPIGRGSPVLFIQDDDLERARSKARGCEVTRVADLAEAVADRLEKEGGKRIGIAGAAGMGLSAVEILPQAFAVAIRNSCADAELVDAGATVQALRTIRSPRELDALREASRIADLGAEAFLSTMREGISERDVWSEIWYVMQKAGADDLHISLCRGPGSFWPHPASDAVFASGDVVSIELSPRIEGYFSQANRMCFVGDEGREWDDLAKLARGALDLAMAEMKPGAVAKDVVAKVRAFVESSPLATMDVGGVHRIGHGCGIALDEGPFLTSASAAKLEVDMTMACHPMVYLPYRHSLLMLGDYMHITPSGARPMTRPQASIPAV